MSDLKRILIVDDEPLARQKIARYLKQSGHRFLVEEADHGIAAVEKIQFFNPEIVFLDVQMPGLSGFEVLQQFTERPFLIVFQTAFDEFAIRAFEEHACDYLLKPFTPERFQRALEHTLTRVADEEKLKSLVAKMSTRDGPLQKLSVRQGNRLRILEAKDILCFVSKNHYTCVYGHDLHEAITELSLNTLMTRLDPHVFTQLHRNNIVRIEAVLSLTTTRDGEMFVELPNGLKLPVSRSHRAKAKEFVYPRPRLTKKLSQIR